MAKKPGRRSSRLPRILADQLQAFHGYEIWIESETVNRYRVWTVEIPETGFRFRGNYVEAIACLRGYQAGYQTGRKYTGDETRALRGLISELGVAK